MSRDMAPERGAVAVWTSVVLVAFVILVGLGVDLAGHAATEQEARSLAFEAARAGGQYVQLDPAGVPRADVSAVVRAAESYLASSGFHGEAQVSGGEIRVTVTGAHATTFLGVIGVDSLPVRGEAAAAVGVVVGGGVR